MAGKRNCLSAVRKTVSRIVVIGAGHRTKKSLWFSVCRDGPGAWFVAADPSRKDACGRKRCRRAVARQSCGTVSLASIRKILARPSNRRETRLPYLSADETWAPRRAQNNQPVFGRDRLASTMSDRFRLDIALYLADAAGVGRKVADAELAARFGEPPTGWGPIMTTIAGGLHKRGCPLLPVMLVATDTGLPPANGMAFEQFGLSGEQDLRMEQQRCRDFNWPAVFFSRPPTDSSGRLDEATAHEHMTARNTQGFISDER